MVAAFNPLERQRRRRARVVVVVGDDVEGEKESSRSRRGDLPHGSCPASAALSHAVETCLFCHLTFLWHCGPSPAKHHRILFPYPREPFGHYSAVDHLYTEIYLLLILLKSIKEPPRLLLNV